MNRYSLVIIALSIAMALMSAWRSDWNSLLVAAMGIAIVGAPIMMTGDPNKGYDKHLMGIAIIPLVLFIILFVADSLFHIQYYDGMSLAVDSMAIMAFGMMIAVFLNASTSISLPRRWVILFAYVLACSVAVIFTFSTFIWMASQGYPLYNGDFKNGQSNDLVNSILMLPGAVTAISAIIYSIVFNMYLKRVGSLELSRLTSGDAL